LRAATDSELRYDLFLGNVVFRIGDADFSADWGWVPVLDFALGLEHAIGELLRGRRIVEFEFTESERVIQFQRQNDDIVVSASYAPYGADIALGELADAMRSFRKQVIEDLSSRYPALRMNSAMRRITEVKP
jgi:hypothetical protein